MAVIATTIAIVATLALRMWPRLDCRAFGIDTWYFLAYARALRRQRRWPVTMPYYLLDDPEQVYPPGLPWLLSWWPTRWLERWHWCMSAAVDALHCAMLCSLVWVVSHSGTAVGVAGLLFATSPVLVAQATELNARPVGGILFTFFMLSLWGFEQGSGWVAAGVVLLTGTLVLWTHKMTAQQMTAALLAWSLIHWDLRYVLLGLGTVGLSILVSRGLFLNVLRGHQEIVRFWRKHLSLLGAHQVYQSSLYTDPEKAKRRAGVTGFRASPAHRWLAAGHLVLIAAIIVWMAYSGFSPTLSFSSFFLHWTVLVFATVFATRWIPGFTQFGEGFKYLRYGVFPWSLLLALWMDQQAGSWIWALPSVLICMQLLVVIRIVRAQKYNYLASIDEDTRVALLELARQPEDGVLALPVSRSEAIAYFCEKQVLWGGHGGGWDRLELFFPVLRRPVEAFFDEYKLRWLWVDTRYVDVNDLRLPGVGFDPWLSQGHVRLFRYDPDRKTSAMIGASAASTVG